MDMKTVDTMACFSDSKMSNNLVNYKAWNKIKKCCKLHSIHYHTKVFKWFYDNFVDVPSLVAELPLVRELGPQAVIVDIGTNDLSCPGVDPALLASRIVSFGQSVFALPTVSEVVLCQLLPRVAIRPTGRRRFPVRADFNEARFVVNRTLEGLTRDLTHIQYWRHRGMHADWEPYFWSIRRQP